MPPPNRAAWIPAPNKPLEIKSAPYTPPGKNEIVVKVRAVALNPVDYMIQTMGKMIASWVQYPFIMGDDVAGEVVQVGLGVTRFQPDDRVVGHAVSMDKRSNRSCEGAFQEYAVLRTNLVSPIPEYMTFENACVLPLCLSTAACGLFMKDYLALRHPNTTTSKGSTGQTLLVWGGSTAVGRNAVQLAVAAGYDVIATSSPKNFSYMSQLGASQAFDYHSPTVVPDIIIALKGKQCAGAIAIGDGSMPPCIDIVAASSGSKFIAQASVPQPAELPPKGIKMVSFVSSLILFFVSTWFKCKVKGVESKMIWGDDLMENEVGSAIYEGFLPDALQEGKYVATPEPYVVSKGLEGIQEGLKTAWKGFGAKKVVVTL
ncbi:zinc-binding oxidoreductase CipB [Lojkania enalia]|uniref:Zinc-binding oxidoreductase CipB n=1 Tax=Lojkania enalia TaxID=147567 RepID=A0A9P4MXL6_9PLEO|nr:zinc-binding oxidoreductase CipB [Didymosphaeria enalia]